MQSLYEKFLKVIIIIIHAVLFIEYHLTGATKRVVIIYRSSPILTMQRKPVGGGVGGGKNFVNRNQPRPRQQVRGGRNNSFVTNSSIDETLKKIQQQQQAQNNEQQRPPIQDDRNQYLIQPQRQHEGKQTASRPLPHLLQTAQIENIIGRLIITIFIVHTFNLKFF